MRTKYINKRKTSENAKWFHNTEISVWRYKKERTRSLSFGVPDHVEHAVKGYHEYSGIDNAFVNNNNSMIEWSQIQPTQKSGIKEFEDVIRRSSIGREVFDLSWLVIARDV